MANLNYVEPTSKNLTEFSELKIKLIREYTNFIAKCFLKVKITWCNEKDFAIAGVKENEFVINLYYWNDLNKKVKMFVLLHEILHLLLKHPQRIENRNSKFWNYACDITVNNYILFILIADGAELEVPFEVWHKKSWVNLTTEQIYNKLIKDNLIFKNAKVIDKHYNSKNSKNKNIPIPPNGQSGLGSALGSSIPDLVVFSKTSNNQLPWYKLITKNILDKTKTNTKTILISRRTRHLFNKISIPSKKYIGNKIPAQIVAYVDVSSSLTVEQLQLFINELLHIKNVINTKELVIKPFNTKLLKPVILSSNSVNQIKLNISGGTSLKQIGKDIEKSNFNSNSTVIIMSDLFCEPMKKPHNIGNVNLIWVRLVEPKYKNYSFFNPSYGKMYEIG